MIGGLFFILLFFGATTGLLRLMARRLKWLPVDQLLRLYWYHMLFAAIYYTFTRWSPSDSVMYYARPQVAYSGWMDAYATGTPFIDFVSYPFINFLGFSYEMMMVMFAWLGYWGFVFFYIFFRENIPSRITWKRYDMVNLLIFLPNMHYWTASLGKGSIIFFGLGLIAYGLTKAGQRKLGLLAGLILVYHVRPHIFLFILAAILLGLFTGRQKTPLYQKLLMLAACTVAILLLYDRIVGQMNLDADNLLDSYDQFAATRSFELAKSNSGIDISKYPLVLKLFTFWFRPLFFDAPGPVGILVSFENLFYLALALRLFRKDFPGWLIRGPALVKMSAITFFLTSFALSGTLSNLGIIMRQKTMVMYFFAFIVLSYLDYRKKKVSAWRRPSIAGQSNAKTKPIAKI